MTKPKIVLNSKQVRAVMRSREVELNLLARAKRVASAAGPGFEAASSFGPNRARASVYPATSAAKRAEAKVGALSKALDAGRG